MAIFVAKNGSLQTLKGVFECKNMLREGVDYEGYDWLKADIPISTTMMSLPINSKNFEFQRNFIQLMNSSYFFTGSSSNNSYAYFITDTLDMNDLRPQIWNGESNIVVYTSSSKLGLGIHTITANDNGITISSATNTATLPWYGNEANVVIFNNANNVNKKTIHLTSSIKVDGVTRYVPCQLLKPIPASLDANNRARSAGECGMYDSISGKFFGNVASTGSFTVVND
jgi:hypothetical protein